MESKYKRWVSLTFLLLAVKFCLARQDYQTMIPNGHKVGHPCFPNTIWKGVGHQYHGGGSFLNQFGKDFRDNGFKWDSCLCENDSDKDGRTNGEELGDPNCVWTIGELPEITDNISHPGICQPVGSAQCTDINTWDVCAEIEFTCSGLNDPKTEVQDLRFKETVIPKNETSYYCTYVKFDETRDLQAFAMKPYLDNVDLVHHIDMYECMDPNVDDTLPPQPCGAMEGCGGNMLAAWAVGINGLCMNDDVGIRIGKNGAKAASLRIHYHNPFGKENQTDTSGLSFYVTPTLRDNNARVLNLGQMYLEIPPGQVEHEEVITFSDVCTNNFKEDVYLAFGSMHMHYLGTGGYTELWRNEEKVQDIMVQEFYDYNAPHIQNFDPPILIKPGDTIRHVCRYHSRGRTEVTWRGQSAMEEMCHVYFVHYPEQNISHAFNNGALEECSFVDGTSKRHWEKVCDIDEFNQIYNSYMKSRLESVCDTTGKVCNDGCKEMLEWAHNNHSCLSEDARTAIYKNKYEMRMMQTSCRDYPPIVQVPSTTQRPEGICIFGTSGTPPVHQRMFMWTLLFQLAVISTLLHLL